MLRWPKLASVLSVVALTGSVIASPDPADKGLLCTRVREFEFHGRKETRSRGHIAESGSADITAGALALAVHAEVRICIEAVPWMAGHPIVPVEVKVRNRTVGEILGLMVRQDPRYTFRERLGVIEVLPASAARDPTDCLNTVIPEFHVHYPWKYAWVSLRCALDIILRNPSELVPDPIGVGQCSGGSHLLHAPATLLEATFEHTSVRDILDQLASLAGNVAWSASYDGRAPTCQSLHLGEYQPKVWYPLDPQDKEWVEGLPPKCAGCHYHQRTENK
jgi:hypothetical protein